MQSAQIQAIREFNRYWTEVIGALDEGLLDSPHSLTEARVIFELGRRPQVEQSYLANLLSLDPSYLSRILARLRTADLVDTAISDDDRRRSILSLSEKGREVWHMLDERSSAQVAALLDPLADDDRRRLVDAMGTIRSILDRPSVRPIVIRPLRPGDPGWVVRLHGLLYATEYGWDLSFEALVAGIVADFVGDHDDRLEDAWIAEVDGNPVGCVFCVRRDDETAQLRLLAVDASARGMGIGRRLVDECIDFARRAGYRRIMLWTNDVLHAARRIYEQVGFRLVEEDPHHSFGVDLVGQIWERELRA